MRIASIVISSVLALVTLGTEGCSSSSSGTSTAPAGVGEHKSVDIKAAEGGTLTATGGSINVPPGALAADTTITVDVKDKSAYANSSDVAVNVFDFGPNGTKFLKPVSMTIDLQGVAVPSGKTAKIAYYDGSAWKTLDDSQVAGGKVTATTTHFTPFTVVFSGGTQTSGSCGGAFTACGGDLTGTWTFSAACANVPPTALNAPWSTCPTATISATIDMQGSITFNADKTYTVSDTMNRTIDGTLPKTCLGSGQTCQSIIDASKGDTATDTGTDCKVTGTSKESTPNETGTWTTSGTTFTTTKTGGSGSTSIAYCVTGNTLVAQQQGDKGVTIQYTATKK